MDRISKKKRSKIMSAIRSKHTSPELVLRQILRKKGVRYKLHYGKEKVDIALPSRKIAIFMDGCFWHHCPLHGHIPKSNRGYWVPKIRKNKKRAKMKDARLRKAGWKLVHIWEHELKNPGKIMKKIH